MNITKLCLSTLFCDYGCRWVLRIKSLKTVRGNYNIFTQFFEILVSDDGVDCSISCKASGFHEQMVKFVFLFLLTTMIEIFDRIEILNKDLQNTELSVIESCKKIEAVYFCLQTAWDSKFEVICQKSIHAIQELQVDEPTLPRHRKIPKRLDSNETNHVFKTPKDFYRKIYFEIFDSVLLSLKSRFNTESIKFFKSLEQFSIGEFDNVEQITEFYRGDFEG